MTPREAGAQLGLHASSVRNRIAAGTLAATKTDRGWEIDPAELARYQRAAAAANLATARAWLATGTTTLAAVAQRWWGGDIDAARCAIYAGCEGGRPR